MLFMAQSYCWLKFLVIFVIMKWGCSIVSLIEYMEHIIRLFWFERSAQKLSVRAINRIFYLFKCSEAFESANIINLVLSILVSLKRPYRYSQNFRAWKLSNYNFLKFYVQFLLSFVYPYILKSRSFSRCHTNKSGPKHASLVLFDWFHIHRLCITGKLSDVQCFFFLNCVLLTS